MGDVGDDQRDQHANHRGADAVERLETDQQPGIAARCHQQGTRGHRREAGEQHQPAAMRLCELADPRRQRGGDQLRHDDGGGDHQSGAVPAGPRDGVGGERQKGGVAEIEQREAGAEQQQAGIGGDLPATIRVGAGMTRRRGDQHQAMGGEQADQQSGGGNDENCDPGGEALVRHRVDQQPSRYLRRHRRHGADRQREANLGTGPAVGGEIDRQKGAKPRLHEGDEEVEPVEAAEAARGHAGSLARPTPGVTRRDSPPSAHCPR